MSKRLVCPRNRDSHVPAASFCLHLCLCVRSVLSPSRWLGPRLSGAAPCARRSGLGPALASVQLRPISPLPFCGPTGHPPTGDAAPPWFVGRAVRVLSWKENRRIPLRLTLATQSKSSGAMGWRSRLLKARLEQQGGCCAHRDSSSQGVPSGSWGAKGETRAA